MGAGLVRSLKTIGPRNVSWVLVLTAGLVGGVNSCSLACGPGGLKSISSSCRSISSSKIALTRIGGTAACGAVVNSRKVQISCAPTSGSFATCTSPSSGSAYYLVLVPNNASGSFRDSDAASTLYGNCNDLWNAMATSPTPLVNVTALYFSDPTVGDSVTCTDIGGCSVTSTNCFVGWDGVNGVATTTATGIANGTNLLACAFLGSPTAPNPPPIPGVGLIGVSGSNAFFPLTVSATPIVFSTWVDY